MARYFEICLPEVNYLYVFITAYTLSVVQLISKQYSGNDLGILLSLAWIHIYGFIFSITAIFIYWGLVDAQILFTGNSFSQVLGAIAVGVSINGITSFSILKGKDKEFGLQPIIDLFVEFLTPYIKASYERRYDLKVLNVIHSALDLEFKDLDDVELVNGLIESTSLNKLSQIEVRAIRTKALSFDGSFEKVMFFYDQFDLQPIVYFRNRRKLLLNSKKAAKR